MMLEVRKRDDAKAVLYSVARVSFLYHGANQDAALETRSRPFRSSKRLSTHILGPQEL